jgi:hypothetical protein
MAAVDMKVAADTAGARRAKALRPAPSPVRAPEMPRRGTHGGPFGVMIVHEPVCFLPS